MVPTNITKGMAVSYEDMSDNEINEQVADLMGGYAGNVHGSETQVKVKDAATNGMFYMEVDYCNNPSDAWPIIMENHITIFSPDYNKGDSDWRSELYDSDEGIFDFTDKNPLRAAMIVFLMMQEQK